MIFRGYYLQCPDEIQRLSAWPAKEIYNEIVTKCFVIDPNNRSSFKDLVEILNTELEEEEKLKYNALTTQYYNKNLFVSNVGQDTHAVQTRPTKNVLDMSNGHANLGDTSANVGYLSTPHGARIDQLRKN